MSKKGVGCGCFGKSCLVEQRNIGEQGGGNLVKALSIVGDKGHYMTH